MTIILLWWQLWQNLLMLTFLNKFLCVSRYFLKVCGHVLSIGRCFLHEIRTYNWLIRLFHFNYVYPKWYLCLCSNDTWVSKSCTSFSPLLLPICVKGIINEYTNSFLWTWTCYNASILWIILESWPLHKNTL